MKAESVVARQHWEEQVSQAEGIAGTKALWGEGRWCIWGAEQS